MIKSLLVFSICWILALYSSAQTTSRLLLYYETDHYELTPKQLKRVDSFIVAHYDFRYVTKISIYGHTDNVADHEYNVALSKERAQWLSIYLLKKKNLPNSLIQCQGFSYDAPQADNASKSGKALNRRTELIIEESESEVTPPLYPSTSKNALGIDIPYQTTQIDPAKGGLLISPSGSTISIPPNVFVDDKGQAALVPVTIYYREFRDPADFITLGVPMEYKYNKERLLFNSAGMFEIHARNGNKELLLKQGDSIRMEFMPTSNMPSVGFYNFDLTTRNWDFEKMLTETSMLPEISDSAYTENPLPLRELTLDERYLSPQYNFIYPKARNYIIYYELPYWKSHPINIEFSVPPIEEGQHISRLSITDTTNSMPELATFANYYLKLDYRKAEMIAKGMQPLEPSNGWINVAFTDIRITRSSFYKEVYRAELKSEKGWVAFNFTFQAKHARDKHFVPDSIFNEYERGFLKRRKNFDNRAYNINRELNKYKSQDPCFRKLSLSFNDDDIYLLIKFGIDTLQKKYASQLQRCTQENMMVQVAKDGTQYRSINVGDINTPPTFLTLRTMGISNCDRVRLYDSPFYSRGNINMGLIFKSPGGQTITPTSIHFIRKDLNTVAAIDKSFIPLLFFCPDCEQKIVVTDANKLYIVNTSEINRALNEGGSYAIMNTREYPLPKNVTELRSIISQW